MPTMAVSALIVVSGMLVQHAFAQEFSLYPTVDQGLLADALGISSDCLDALNTTLPCDQTLFQMAGSVDNYYWELDNMTTLCSNDCMLAAQLWSDDVANRCFYDNIVAYDKIVPASSVSGRFQDGISVACLTNGNSTLDEDTAYCLIESQDWVGSDLVIPDCTSDSTDPSCVDPADVSPDNERLANLYSDDILCSECFVQMLYQRLLSPFLPDHDFSDYLIEQYQDILDVCNATDNMPELIIRALPDYETATPPALNFTGISTDTDCTGGQYIVTSSLASGASCDSISQAFNVATGAIQAATNNTTCSTTAQSFCLPPACSLQQVPSNATCDSLASSFSTSNLTVGITQLLTWNPNIGGLCDNLTVGDYVCAAAPGGSYVPPPPPPGSTSDNAQQRGGSDGSDLLGNATLVCTSFEPVPVQDGISSNCQSWCQAVSGDYCFSFAQEASITTDELYTWNPTLGSGGVNCSTQFQAAYWYCVAGPGAASASASATSSSPSATQSCATAPGPTQTGMPCQCTEFVQQEDSKYCGDLAADNDITLQQFYQFNPAVGDSCQYLVGGDWYCVAAASSAQSTTTSKTATSIATTSTASSSTCATAPGPTQTGMPCGCNTFVQQTSGKYCSDLASDAGITLTQFYTWNPAVGDSCQYLQGGDYYCVSA